MGKGKGESAPRSGTDPEGSDSLGIRQERLKTPETFRLEDELDESKG